MPRRCPAQKYTAMCRRASACIVLDYGYSPLAGHRAIAPLSRQAPNIQRLHSRANRRDHGGMPSDEADKFRKQADECREQAAKAYSPLDKEAWLRVAEEWIKLAMSVEGRRE